MLGEVFRATTAYQRALEQQVAAAAECDRLEQELAAAEAVRREIGRQVKEAKRALDEANHRAAGVEYVPA